jgi:hypothetical protein
VVVRGRAAAGESLEPELGLLRVVPLQVAHVREEHRHLAVVLGCTQDDLVGHLQHVRLRLLDVVDRDLQREGALLAGLDDRGHELVQLLGQLLVRGAASLLAEHVCERSYDGTVVDR